MGGMGVVLMPSVHYESWWPAKKLHWKTQRLQSPTNERNTPPVFCEGREWEVVFFLILKNSLRSWPRGWQMAGSRELNYFLFLRVWKGGNEMGVCEDDQTRVLAPMDRQLLLGAHTIPPPKTVPRPPPPHLEKRLQGWVGRGTEATRSIILKTKSMPCNKNLSKVFPSIPRPRWLGHTHPNTQYHSVLADFYLMHNQWKRLNRFCLTYSQIHVSYTLGAK